MPSLPVVRSLIIYPVKGCRGIEVQAAHVTRTGFPFDRNWVVVNDPRGSFISQRQKPELALVKTWLPEGAFADGAGMAPNDACLTLSAPDMETLQVPLNPPDHARGDLKRTAVWGWEGLARDEGELAAEWWTEYLGRPCRLMRYAGGTGSGTDDASTRRPVEEDFAPGHEVAFPDAFPFLIANEASLAELNSRLDEPLPMNRFRPNIVVAGAAPFEEDSWASFFLGAVHFKSAKPCSRCKVTTTNQDTAEVAGPEPLAALRTFRSGELLGYKRRTFQREVFFGWYLVAPDPGRVAVGDALQVTDLRKEGSF